MNIKRYIGLKLDKTDGRIKRALMRLNGYIFHYNARYHKKRFGEKNPDLTFYVIRSTGMEEGLLSLFFTVMRDVAFAKENNMIPVVDFQNYKTQYNSELEEFAGKNAWEYYFKPVSAYSLEEVYESKNVYLSGWNRPGTKSHIFQSDYSEELNKKRNEFIKECTGVQPYLEEKTMNYCREHRISDKTLGVYVRGTDYIKLEPKGHPRQPKLEEVLEKVDAYVKEYDIKQIFLVTEDYNIYQTFREQYPGMILTSESTYIKDYKDNYISHIMTDEPYTKGLNYLMKMLIFNECPYIVTTVTNGSLFSLALREKEVQDKYVFDLGKY